MAAIEKLVNSYVMFIKENIFIEKLEEGIYEIETPFLDRRNDVITLYAMYEEDDSVRITDNGYTVSDLSMSGLEFNTEKRKQELNTVLKGFGVHYNTNTQELWVKTTATTFARKKHNLIQALLSVNDMFVLAQSKVKSLFFEDVGLYLDSHDIRYSPNIVVEGVSTLTHKFEYVIPKSKNAPERIIKTVNTPKRENIKAILFSFDDTSQNREGSSYVMINDENSVKSDIIEAFNSYQVKPMFWSQRDSYVAELSA